MKKLFILLIIFTYLMPCSYTYGREKNMNLFDSSGWVRPFHIGGVACDQKQNIWSEACQDVMLQDIYGHIWPEVKQVILDFQKAVAEGNYLYLKGKTVIPTEDLLIAIFIGYKPEYSGHESIIDHIYISKEADIKSAFFNKITQELRKKIKNIKYEDIKFNIWGQEMIFGDKCKIGFKLICPEEVDDNYECHYIPKIEVISLD